MSGQPEKRGFTFGGRLRALHLWWLPMGLFGGSILMWVCALILQVWLSDAGGISLEFDRHAVSHIYLPFLAAILGVGVPLACLRKLRAASSRVHVRLFVIFVVGMLA